MRRHEPHRVGLLSRIRRNVRKFLLIHKQEHPDSQGDESSSKKRARDWRMLSPECPPLPTVEPVPTANGDAGPSSAEHLTSLTDQLDTTIFAFSHYRQPIGPLEGRHLYTIPEEGETMATPIRNSNEQYPPSSSVRVSDCSSSSSPSSSSTSSNANYRPPTTWFTETPDEPHDDALVGDEVRCQLKFARVVHAACKQQQHDQNARTEILFDDYDNVRSIRIITRQTDDKVNDEYWRFSGNSQYIPPELSCGVYNQTSADVWVMGIILYRMLAGKYPFSAPNDRKLFSKMMHGDFSIPQQLSEDAKDLLRRMLAPGNARASLDLILFHPWLKPCSSILLANNASSSSPAPAQPPPPPPPPTQRSTGVRTEYAKSLPRKKVQRRKRRRVAQSIMWIFCLLTKGPYPPPKRPYRELVLLGRVHLTTTVV
ncbi:kinase-like domain-containing protein [Fennellomyces sp. T-0311]|nr:kinase-like domain-containing protein [Fennellomyces sp. T-0311]